MTLIILLMVLLVERVALQSSTWQVNKYLDWYGNKCLKRVKTNDAISLFLFVIAPALIAGILLYFLNSRLVEFVVGLFVLAVCIGHYPLRTTYRQYLNALQRNDTEAMAITHNQLMGEPEESDSETVGETLVWINLQYYVAPIFFYIIFGIPGVMFYSTVLFLSRSELLNAKDNTNEVNEITSQKMVQTWLEWLMWVPARLGSLGFMFVGHFGHGLESWLRLAGDLSLSSKEVTTKVAMASETLNDSAENNAEIMVKLAKRNMILILVSIALLTLYGRII